MKLFSWFLTVLLVLCGALVTPTSASDKTIKVPQDHNTIQAAVNAASPGDTILVDNGIYKESVIIKETRLTLKAKNRRGAVVDGEWKRAFGFHALEGADIDDIVIQGFEIRHFQSAGVHAYHEGNRRYNSWKVVDNYIHHAVDKGILLSGPGHTIDKNEIAFIGNSGEAMGIQVRSANNSTISDNIIYVVRKNGIRVSSSGNVVKNNLIAYAGPGIAINHDKGGNVVMNNYVFTTNEGIIPKHSDCSKGFNRIIHNTVVETTEANLVLGENNPAGDCLEVLNNIFAGARQSLIKDTVNRGQKFELNFNFYDDSFAYILPGSEASHKSFNDYQMKIGFDKHSVVGEPRLVNPFLGPQLRDNSHVFSFPATSVQGGLGRQVGARSEQKFPFMLKRLSMQPDDASSNLSDAKHTTDREANTVWTSSRRNGPHSILYKLDGTGTPKYDILWMTPADHKKRHNIKQFAVEVSTDRMSFERIYTATVDDSGAAHFHKIGLQTAKFIRVIFLQNFGADKFKVDDIWVAQYLPTDAASTATTDSSNPILPPPTTLKRLSTSLTQ